ncbi:MAG: hypothetical protein GY799_06865 [Desulfobulbaceae bacterium]|nr:hypothetical protein [Desulfobulbaceae bacterium]
MVYSYLLDLYRVLDKRKNEIQFQMSQLSNDPEALQLQQGRLAVINGLKVFLTDNYHAKLPRRIQKFHN